MNILSMMAWCLLEKRGLRERDLICSWNTIGPGTSFRSVNMAPGVAAPLQYKGSDSGEGGKTHSNPDHVYIHTWQYFLIAWPIWESLTCGGPPVRVLRAGRERSAQGSERGYERTFTKLAKWEEEVRKTEEAAGFINTKSSHCGSFSLGGTDAFIWEGVRLRKGEGIPPAVTLSESLYKWTTGSKWPPGSFGEMPIGKMNQAFSSALAKKKKKMAWYGNAINLKAVGPLFFLSRLTFINKYQLMPGLDVCYLVTCVTFAVKKSSLTKK